MGARDLTPEELSAYGAVATAPPPRGGGKRDLTPEELSAYGGAPAAAPQGDRFAMDDTGGGMTAGRAGVLGVSQGGTFGFADEIGGLVGKMLIPEGVKANTEPQDGDSPEVLEAKARIAAEQAHPKSSYELVRDGMREEANRAAEQHKAAYGVGRVAGELGAMYATGGGASWGKGVKGAAGLLQRGGAAVANAVGYGGLNAAGASEADDATGVAADTIAGSVTAIPFALGGQALGEGLGALGGVAKRYAADIAKDTRIQKIGEIIDQIRSLRGKAGKQAQEAVGGVGNVLDVAEHAPDPAAFIRSYMQKYGFSPAEIQELLQRRLSNAAEKGRDFFDNRINVPQVNRPAIAAQAASAAEKALSLTRSGVAEVAKKYLPAGIVGAAAGGYITDGSPEGIIGGAAAAVGAKTSPVRYNMAKLVGAVLETNPVLWARWGAALAGAVSPESLSARIHVILQKDPELRTAVQKEQEQPRNP